MLILKWSSYLFYQKILLIVVMALPIGLLISTGVSEIIVIFSTLIFLTYSIIHNNFKWINNKYFYLLIVFWLSLLINFFFSENKELSLVRSFGFIKYIIYIFAIKFVLDNKKNRSILFLFLLIITLLITFDINFEYINKKNILGFQSSDPTRIASFLGKELKIAHFLLGFAMISIGYYFQKFNKKSLRFTIIGYTITLVLLISIFLTGERANSIKGFICILIFIIIANNHLKFKKIFILVLIISPIVIYFSSERIKIRYDQYLSSKNGNANLLETYKNSHHAAHYYTAFQIFKSYPFFGVGNKNFREECLNEKYNNKSYKRIGERCSTHPHQIYLELLSEHGIIGTVIILFVFFYTVFLSSRNFYKKRNLIQLGAILYVMSVFLPFIPSGSFFTSFGATIFWFNYAIMLFYNDFN
jgi:O-antigen ligase